MIRFMTIAIDVLRSRFYAKLSDWAESPTDKQNLIDASKGGPEAVGDRVAWVAFCERADIAPAFDPGEVFSS